MAARAKQCNSEARREQLRLARLFRQSVFQNQPMPWNQPSVTSQQSKSQTAEICSSLDGTHSRICANRTLPAAKSYPGAKRKGAKAVKRLERAENAEFLLSREEATLFRALAARANFLSQDRPDINFSTKELCREFSQPNQKSFLKLKRLVRYLIGLPRLV